MTTTIIRNALLTGLAALALTATTYAGHEANNRAELAGAAGTGVTGQAIVNYVKGTGGWASTVSVMGLPDGIYTFAVVLNTGRPQPICNFEISGEGRGGCSDNDAVLMGFNQALILDGDDVAVAGGVFVRRGGNRDK